MKSQKKQTFFGRMYPNAGYQVKYRRELRRMIKAMRQDTLRELAVLYNEKTLDAPPTLRAIMAALRKKWYVVFEKRARQMAKWLADTVQKRTQQDVAKQLKELGLAFKPDYTDKQKSVIREIVKQNVALIKTIPRDFLGDVQEIVGDAMERGGDRAAIKEAIEDKIDKEAVKDTERRAALISRDQVQKATQEFARENAKAYGATKAEWIHIPGEKSSRITHMHMDGKEFNIDEGLYDEAVQRKVKPGELPYCMCSQRFIFPEEE